MAQTIGLSLPPQIISMEYDAIISIFSGSTLTVATEMYQFYAQMSVLMANKCNLNLRK